MTISHHSCRIQHQQVVPFRFPAARAGLVCVAAAGGRRRQRVGLAPVHWRHAEPKQVEPEQLRHGRGFCVRSARCAVAVCISSLCISATCIAAPLSRRRRHARLGISCRVRAHRVERRRLELELVVLAVCLAAVLCADHQVRQHLSRDHARFYSSF